MENLFNKIAEITKPSNPCTSCEGNGKLYVSDCCGASPISNGDSDTSDIGICPDCGDHCSYGVECEVCNGTGLNYT